MNFGTANPAMCALKYSIPFFVSDDVMNISGHRLGSMELESALVSHQAVNEASVVGKPH